VIFGIQRAASSAYRLDQSSIVLDAVQTSSKRQSLPLRDYKLNRMVGTGWKYAQFKHNLGQVRAGQQPKKE